MSVRASTSSSPEDCSGLMYSGEPGVRPEAVSLSVDTPSSIMAMPKSESRAVPPSSMILDGLMSR